MLEALHLTKRYASLPAVQDLSFTLRPGQVLGCLGPNGSGKSTTVKMLTGLLEPTRGLVRFHDRNILDDLQHYRKVLGYVPEEAHLYPYLSGWEYLEMIGALRGMPRAELRPRSIPCSNCFPCTRIVMPVSVPIPRGCGSGSCSSPPSCMIRKSSFSTNPFLAWM